MEVRGDRPEINEEGRLNTPKERRRKRYSHNLMETGAVKPSLCDEKKRLLEEWYGSSRVAVVTLRATRTRGSQAVSVSVVAVAWIRRLSGSKVQRTNA